MSDYLAFPFLCFHCRRSFKIDCSNQAYRSEFGVEVWQPQDNGRPCPLCKNPLVFAGAYLRTPPQSNRRRWKMLQTLVQNGWRDEYPSPQVRILVRSANGTREWTQSQRQLTRWMVEERSRERKRAWKRRKKARQPIAGQET